MELVSQEAIPTVFLKNSSVGGLPLVTKAISAKRYEKVSSDLYSSSPEGGIKRKGDKNRRKQECINRRLKQKDEKILRLAERMQILLDLNKLTVDEIDDVKGIINRQVYQMVADDSLWETKITLKRNKTLQGKRAKTRS